MLAGWRPPLWGVAATVAGVAAFVSLGLWQLDRADEKRAMLALDDSAAAAPALQSLDATQALGPELRFRRARLQGRYEGSHQVLLQSMTSGGRDGFQVLTPLRLENGALLMVNRGWVAADAPGSTAEDLAVDDAARSVYGRLNVLPRPGLRLGDNAPAGPHDADWPRLYLYPTAEELSIAFGEPVADVQLQLDANAPAGFERDWPTVNAGPERHVGYALQWFTFALVLVVIFVLLTRPRSPGSQDNAA